MLSKGDAFMHRKSLAQNSLLFSACAPRGPFTSWTNIITHKAAIKIVYKLPSQHLLYARLHAKGLPLRAGPSCCLDPRVPVLRDEEAYLNPQGVICLYWGSGPDRVIFWVRGSVSWMQAT